ncbi:MAG TPA: hypothetical protein VHX39_28640, partial [Acetobacteraceae bacterium]|nr:hypothetical protein [Acetobacteraceae bacterium]
MNIQVYMSPSIAITSVMVGGAGSEALAGLGITGGTFTGTPVNGTVSGNNVTFNNVPTSVGAFTIAITNIRINASQIASANNVPTAVSEAIFLGGSAVTPTVLQANYVAFALPGLTGITATGTTSFPVCSAISSAAPAFSVHFAEQFAPAFMAQGSAVSNSTLGSEFTFDTETGFGIASNGFSNTASAGTRIKIVFSNVPANLTLAVPESIANSGGTMILTASETGPFSEVPVSAAPNLVVLSVVNGTATAIYEETTSAPQTIESYTVPVYLTGAAGAVPSQASAIAATVSFAPIGATANLPNFVSGSSTVTVNGANLSACGSTIAFPSLTSVPFGTGNVNLSATSNSPAPITFSSTTPSVCSVAGSVVSVVAGGSCSITASQAANPYYAAANPIVESFTVTPGSQTINFGSIGNVPFGAATVAVSATASSGLPVSFSSSTPAVCTVSVANVALVAPGLCTIVASQAGNPSYAAAPTAQQSFTIAQTSQTIAFDQIPNQLLGISPFAIAAQSTSGLTVGVTSTTTPVCKVSGRIVTLLGTGTCSLKATQAGNANFGAATVTQNFTVSQAKPSGGLNAAA